MNALRSTTRSLVAVFGVALGLATVTGCSAKPVEGLGSSSSKLLAPRAMFKGAASAETRRVLGIAEWRIYQGKTSYIVTGYSSKGKAVKGLSIAFSGAPAGGKPQLDAHVLDGSHFSATHVFGGETTASASIKTLSQTFMTQAVHDLTALRMNLKTSITRSAIHTGEACGGDLVKIAMTSIQCIATASSSGSSVSKMIKIKQCVAAAESASNAVESCKNAGTTTPEAADKAAADKPAAGGKSTTGKSSSDPAAADKKQDAEQDAADKKQEAADKKQDAEQDAADAKAEAADKKQDAEQDAADDKQAAADKQQDAAQDAADAKADEAAGADATKASEGQTCTSCEGTGASDVKADDTTGEVQQADASAETGAADTGSSDTSDSGDTGGDTSDSGDVTEA